MHANIPVAVLGLSLTLSACGRSRMPDVAAYQKLAADVSVAVEKHAGNTRTLGPQDCPAEMGRYEADVRPLLERMTDMSVEMDAHMRDMGRSGFADMQAGCRAMTAELDDHLAAACAAGDIQAETTRHASAMAGMLGHEMDDAVSMQEMMGGWMMSGGGCR